MARKSLALTLALSSAFVVGCSTWESMTGGGDSSQKAAPSFSKADKDGSGSVERSEAAGLAGIDFSSADRDGDGKLSRSEYEAASKGK
jgi:hypothetical protein